MQPKQSRILLVGENSEERNKIVEALDGADYAVREAASSTEGLLSFRELKPDIILLYVPVDDANAVELLELFSSESPHLPCIVLSSDGSSDFILRMLRKGAADFVDLRDFDVKEMFSAIERQETRIKLMYEHGCANTLKHATLGPSLPQFWPPNNDPNDVSGKVKSLFLANVSHELRTPLHGILGLADLIIAGVSPDAVTDYCLTIRHSALELLASVNKLIDMAHLETSRMLLRTEPFSLRSSLRDFLITYLDQAQWKGLSFSYRVAPRTPDRLQGDIGRLCQVLDHLLNNAIKFTQEGRVELEVEVAPDSQPGRNGESGVDYSLPTPGKVTLLFRVRDTGIGINHDQQDDIFTPFMMGENFLVKKYRGLGLGLSIAHSLAQLMGGKLEVESEHAKGSCFTLELSFWEDTSGIGAPRPQGFAQHLKSPGVDMASMNPRLDIQAAAKRAGLNVSGADPAWQPPQRSPGGMPKVSPQPNFINFVEPELESAREQAPEVKPSEAILNILPNKTILLVEDDPVNRMLALGFLEMRGYTVLCANNGQEALDLVDKDHIDLILMDIQMPVMDGVTATEKIRAKGGHFTRLPIIAVTAHALDGDREHFLSRGFSSYVSKPVNFPKLIDMLQAVLA